MGTNIGAGLYARARRAAWITGAYNVASMLLLAALFIGAGEYFLRFFTTQDVIVRRAQDYLAVVGPSYTAFGLAIVLGNALVGAGSTRLALRIDLVRAVPGASAGSWGAIAERRAAFLLKMSAKRRPGAGEL